MAKSYQVDSSKFLSPEEVDHLKALIASIRSENERDSLLLELALKCGGRACEIIKTESRECTGIRKQDLNRSFKSVHLRGLKNSNDRDVGLSPDLFKRLESYAAKIEGEYLFEMSYQNLDKLWKFYRPSKKDFHSLRHTFAVELYRKTKDILLVKRAMGHKSINSTMVYTQIPIEAKDFRRMAI